MDSSSGLVLHDRGWTRPAITCTLCRCHSTHNHRFLELIIVNEENNVELGLQSYCLRGIKDNDSVAEAVKACGLRRLEVCDVHTGWDDSTAFGRLAERYERASVSVVSIGVNKITTDRAAARNLFDCAQAAGLERMSVDFPLEGIDEVLKVAEEMSEQYGVLLGIHNHGGRHWLGSSTALRWVFGRTSRRIGLNLDTAWALDSHENPLEMVREFGTRLHLVHIKDFTFRRDGTPEDVLVGAGNLDLARFDEVLTSVGFAGEAVLESEGDIENPVPALRECVQQIGQTMNLVTIPEAV